MNFRKITTVLLIAMCSTIVLPAFAGNETSLTPTEKTNNSDRAQQLTNRLIEIKNMDKSHLTSQEKKDLRKEVKSIKKASRGGNGVYLSVGAVIIIVLLLILLL